MAFTSNIFKHIISIGYEFETHDISKISMSQDDMVVSNISMQGLKNRVASKEAIKLDNHNYSVYDHNEYIDDPDMDGDVPNNDVMMHTTVDFSNSNFDSQLAPLCKDSTEKNSLYAFKLGRQIYPITFPGDLGDVKEFPCSNFSGVEWIVTYYKPPSSPQIILNTYIDACSRITEQLNGFETKTGSFLIRDTKKVVGYKYRHIYHKPGTNFYFLQRNDGINTNTTRNNFSMQSIEIVPQMTFCVNAVHAMDVMEAMLTFTPTKNTRMGMNLKKLQQEFSLVYECTSLMFPEKKTDIIKKAICMLSLILFKVVVYVNRYSVIGAKEVDYYFKDDLTFSVRHSNVTLYNRLIELVGDVKERFTQPIIDRLYSKSKPALSKVVHKRHKRFGDPKFSFQSYFDYLDTGKDWFEVNDIVKFTAMYDFKDDNLMIEHREFGPTIATMMTDRNIHVRNFSPTVEMIQKLNDELISEKKAVNLHNKIYNKNTSRYTKKCKPGQVRDAKFSCTQKNKGISYFKFPCNQANKKLLDYLIMHAREQSSNFKQIFPWEHSCDENYFIYVALEIPRKATIQSILTKKIKPIIYGWLNVSITKWKSYQIAYVSHITTRTDKTVFKGVGTTLIQKMEKDLTPTVDFIKLMPIETATSFYTKIGYTSCLRYDETSLLFLCKTLNREPPTKYTKYMHVQQQKEDDKVLEKEEEILTEILSKLTNPEKEKINQQMKKDETFSNTLIFTYIENGIDAVKTLIE